MIGTEYLEPKDRMEDNYYNGGLLSTAIEIGVLGGGAQLYKKAHKAHIKSRPFPGVARHNSKLKGYPFEASPGSNAKKINRFNDTLVGKGSYKAGARTFNRLGKLTGAMGLFVLGFDLASGIVGASQGFIESRDSIEKERRRQVYNSEDSYFDSRAAFTQRQRAIQVIHNSQMSTRAAMGSESSFMHN